MANKQGKMQNLVNYRMRVILNDGRQMTGQMLAFDKHMNLVLADTEEFRKSRKRAAARPGAPGATDSSSAVTYQEEKRTLGLVILRGTNIVSCSVEGPPPSDPSARLGTSAPGGGAAATTLQPGIGISRPAGRGLPVGLGGPAAGVGGPPPPGGFGGGLPPPGMPGAGPPGGFPGRGGPPPGFGGLRQGLGVGRRAVGGAFRRRLGLVDGSEGVWYLCKERWIAPGYK
ncbi:Small nuclear ribonucleoprotein-associated protein B [Cyphellophora attinorum]|uniref:Sm protein B n=1 Tax=Cyphellophora attinorum TaxID=1664694 RepID=A0A0N1HBR9_9EURO|nr:Small nuclear ribonucleoprotein-associated protein B [Phialophora attinorum]KPI45706.1 Small nuclear ribonucleoprotein-associated protein B [Phialophora attinorum]